MEVKDRPHIFYLHLPYQNDKYFSTEERAIEAAKFLLPAIGKHTVDLELVSENDELFIYELWRDKRTVVASITKYYLDLPVEQRAVVILDRRDERANKPSKEKLNGA